MEAINRLMVRNPMELVWPVVILLVTIAVGWLVRRLALRALHAWISHTQNRAGQILADAAAGPALVWAVLLGAYIAVQSSSLPEQITGRVSEALFVLWMISLTMVSMRIAGNLVRHFGSQTPGALPVTTLSQNLVQIGVLILGLVVLLDHFHISITPILTALGVGGLAVALALQDTLSNLFGGFYVAVARQIRLGDYIKLSSGEEGYVTDIGWRSTTIRGLANYVTIIPNAKLAQAIVTNYYLPEKRMAASLQINVGYSCDPDRIERVLLEVATQGAGEIAGMMTDPAPSVAFDPGFGESSLGFTIGFQVTEFANQFTVRNELRRRILRRFRQEGIEIPFPTRTVRLEASSEEDKGASTRL
ncbi:MAG TPA: mechanosensitive ion channel family protein [Bryobacteraceae bacterium]|nr:mechanosensitive ion channel family protein [Bryobacteraceae bacterium]